MKLVVEKGPRSGDVIACLPPDGANFTVRIGRVVRGNTFAIKDPSISQKHLLIQFASSSGWVLIDLDTSNGTLINGRDLSPSLPYSLSTGDLIKIGEHTTIAVRSGAVDTVATDQDEEEQQTNIKRSMRARGPSTRALQAKAVTAVPARRRRGARRPGIRVNPELETSEGGKDGMSEKRGEQLDLEEFEEKSDLRKKRRRGRGRKVAAGSKMPITRKNAAKVGVEKPIELRDEVVEVEDRILEPNADAKSKNDAEGEPLPEEIVEETKDSAKQKKNGRGRGRRLEVSSCSAKVSEGDPEVVYQREAGAKEDEKEIGVDMEKMTLEEWFGQVEKYLTKVITDTCEEIITELKEKAAKNREFIINDGIAAG